MAAAALVRGLVAVFACAVSLNAQAPDLSGYYQNVAVGVGSEAGSPAGALDAQRARLMWAPTLGPFALGVAYEHTLVWRDAPSTGAGGLLGGVSSGGEWLHLAWTVRNGPRVTWRQRFDRLSATWTRGPVTATVGRQAVSWATTLFLSPADPFAPFDPSDPFREYRTGVDAARVQWFAGPFTVFDVVARGAQTSAGRTGTILARGKTQVAGWEVSAWGGSLHDEAAGAVGVTRTIAGSALRGEAEVRRDSGGGRVVRLAVGVDRRFTVLGRDLYAVAEYQHDPFGALPSGLAAVAVSPAARRGELQVLGRDEGVLQLSYQVHPLVAAELLELWNMRDGSVLVSPAVNISVSQATSIRAGLFTSLGKGVGPTGPRSEYGPLPLSGYLALSAFF